MKKTLSILIVLFVSSNLFAQDLNDYKYALVPSKFSFLKENDQYRMNTLTKMFMDKYGFESYLDSEILPTEFAKENCNKVYVDVQENNSLMVTRLKVVLKDCKNQILFASEEGSSREKDYKVAYNQALREAFNSFDVLKHKYVEKTKQVSQVGIETPIDNSKLDTGETTAEILNSRLSVVKNENGFDLYNIENKLILTAKKTSVKNVYIAVGGIENGVLQKGKDDVWYFEYYRVGSKKLLSEPLLFNLQ